MTGHVWLLIQHYGPTGHTGGFRWHGLTSGLVEQGWTFDVVTTTPADEADAPAGVTVHTVDDEWLGSRLRQGVGRLVDRVRGAAPEQPSTETDRVVPDVDLADDAAWPGVRRRLGDVPLSTQVVRDVVHATELLTQWVWARRVGRLAGRLAERPMGSPAIVITTSPAELLHPVGSRVATEHGASHVMDFRDLWVIGRPEHAMRSRPLRWLGRRFERRSLERAALAVDIASPPSEVRDALGIVPCAFVRSGWAPLDHEPSEPDTDAFRIAYAGWLYPDMDLRPFFDACRILIERRPAAAEVLSIELIGTPTELAGISLDGLARRAGLGDALSISGRLDRDECTRREERAAVLVCFGFTDGMHTPSKLYGYARLRGRLLLMGQADDATARDAAQIGIEAHQNGAAAAEVLVEAFDRWVAGGPWPINDPDRVLSDARPTAQYDELLSAIIEARREPGPSTDIVAAAARTHGAPLPPAQVTLAAVRGEAG